MNTNIREIIQNIENFCEHADDWEQDRLAEKLEAAYQYVKMKNLYANVDEKRKLMFGELCKDNTSIAELDLSVRTYNMLFRAGVRSIGELAERILQGFDRLYVIRNLGDKSIAEIMRQLINKGYILEDPRISVIQD